MWDLSTHRCLLTLRGHSDTPMGLVQLYDGRVVSSSKDQTLRMWSLRGEGCCTHVLRGHAGNIFGLTQLGTGPRPTDPPASV